MDKKQNQSQSEQANQFKCPNCGQMKLRGVSVKVLYGEKKDMIVKTCQSSRCILDATMGRMKHLVLLFFFFSMLSCAREEFRPHYMILIGDSIAEGHPLLHGRLHADWDMAQDLSKPNEVGQLSYYFEKIFAMSCVNQGIGGQSTNMMWRGRWERDVLPNDGTHESTNPYNFNPSIVYIHAGINDIGGKAPQELTIGNIGKMVESALSLGATVYIDTIGPDKSIDLNTNEPFFDAELQQRARNINAYIWTLNGGKVHVIDYLKWASNGTMDFLTLKPGLFADTVHPNKEGYADFAKFVEESVR